MFMLIEDPYKEVLEYTILPQPQNQVYQVLWRTLFHGTYFEYELWKHGTQFCLYCLLVLMLNKSFYVFGV